LTPLKEKMKGTEKHVIVKEKNSLEAYLKEMKFLTMESIQD
jgi:hypothetical protein